MAPNAPRSAGAGPIHLYRPVSSTWHLDRFKVYARFVSSDQTIIRVPLLKRLLPRPYRALLWTVGFVIVSIMVGALIVRFTAAGLRIAVGAGM